ncbi:uncharacterized protein LOC142356181, partial [Convolutriloba macropyga]|uniref:uncharacterized protein LOC142356181 n=1 Tax=Convolutriloba macropyga TaxID=536237 RepID=UPI003F5285CF
MLIFDMGRGLLCTEYSLLVLFAATIFLPTTSDAVVFGDSGSDGNEHNNPDPDPSTSQMAKQMDLTSHAAPIVEQSTKNMDLPPEGSCTIDDHCPSNATCNLTTNACDCDEGFLGYKICEARACDLDNDPNCGCGNMTGSNYCL